MFNDFIGGGQVFLHKVRMFWQVFMRTIHIAFLVGIIVATSLQSKGLKELDWHALFSYEKAFMADSFDGAMNGIRKSLGKNQDHITFINANTKEGVWAVAIDPRKVMRSYVFINTHSAAMDLVFKIFFWSAIITLLGFIAIVLTWSKFGLNLKTEKTKDGSNKVLTAKEVAKALRKIGKASDFKIGQMPLVKDMETRHFLVTGSTGSGKTNLIHNLLSQIEAKKQPAIIIDQTGEMIAKYYNKERGDIIFNPFDDRGLAWDFWTDCESRADLERFSKILIGFNGRQSGSRSDPFWEIAAEAVFNACVEFLKPRNADIDDIANMVCYSDIEYLKTVLVGTEGARYLNDDSKQTASSIAAVLAANAKPLSYLQSATADSCFSMKQYFQNIQNGGNSWLFLATKPSSRSLTLPLIACLTELALAQLMEIGIDDKRRVWTIIDELPALGKLPALSPLMAEGRKYGACVIAGMQSLNQLYSSYGHYDGSTIFGQFGTSFFFRNAEPAIAKMISAMCGSETITRQQKNTSFGANEFRDGVSYNEHSQKRQLVEVEDLANLAVGECYTLLPDPDVKLSKMQMPETIIANKNTGFVGKTNISDKPKEKAVSKLENIDSKTNGSKTSRALYHKTRKAKLAVKNQKQEPAKKKRILKKRQQK